MWQYVVFWILTSQVCLTSAPRPDEWGRVDGFSPAIAVVRTERDTMQKVFASRAEAMDFYKRTVAQIDTTRRGYHALSGFGEAISGARLDSLYLPAGYKQ